MPALGPYTFYLSAFKGFLFLWTTNEWLVLLRYFFERLRFVGEIDHKFSIERSQAQKCSNVLNVLGEGVVFHGLYLIW